MPANSFRQRRSAFVALSTVARWTSSWFSSQLKRSFGETDSNSIPIGEVSSRSTVRGVPIASGMLVVAAAMIVGPLFPRGEISFLLDRNKVAVTQERLRVNNAMYRGEDKRGRPFTVTAGSAVQITSTVPAVGRAIERESDLPRIVGGTKPGARVPMVVVGDVVEDIRIPHKGFRARLSSKIEIDELDLRQRRVAGSGGVSGAIPSGTFSAERISADLDNRILMLDGNVRMRFVQTSFRMPQ